MVKKQMLPLQFYYVCGSCKTVDTLD